MRALGNILLVSSVTYAIKARELLLQSGIRGYVQRIPRTAETGCGYGVYVPKDVDAAEKVLLDNHIRILGRMEQGDGG